MLIRNYANHNKSNSNSLSLKQNLNSQIDANTRMRQITVKKNCCSMAQNYKICQCDYQIYQIRPYTFEILRAILPFFEIIAISNISKLEMESIIDFFESILNKPITDQIRIQQNRSVDQVLRKRSMPNLQNSSSADEGGELSASEELASFNSLNLYNNM